MIAERRATGRRSRRPAVDAARCSRRRGRHGRADRRADSRRGADAAPRRPRDDGERADVDVVSARASTRRRSADCTTRSIACSLGRLPTVADVARGCRWSSGSSPRRCASIRRRGSSAGARSTTIPRRLRGAAARNDLHEPVRDAPRRAVLSRPGTLRSRSLDAGDAAALPKFAYFPVWRRDAAMHRRTVRDDGAGAGRGNGRAAVAAAPGARTSGSCRSRSLP